jgi:murein DD-endopeptidase MepM/ murein hydrolase activator NlpD
LITRTTAATAALLIGLAAVSVQAQEALDVSIVARAVQPGEVVRVDVTCACETAPSASAFGRAVPLALSLNGTRWQGLVGVDLNAAPGSYPLLVEVAGRGPAGPGQPLTRTTVLNVQPARFKTRTLRVAGEYVDPPSEVVDRIVSEAALLDRIFTTITPASATRPFALPLTTRPTPNFGSRSVFNGKPRNPHAGIDFSSPSGTIVTAPAAGTIVLARDLYFTGNTVIIDHGAGLYSLFAHLSSMTVGAGDVAGHGMSLGAVGATGRATGPHLHWSVRLNGARVDPLSLIEATGEPRPQLVPAGPRPAL